MSILTMAQNVAYEVGISPPGAVVSSNDQLVQRILALLKREIYELRMTYDWPELMKEGSITLATSTSSYALPADFAKWSHRTQWDDTNNWELIGPVTSQEWERLTRGFVQNTPRKKFRIKGYTSAQFQINPTPTASENGQIIYFEYFSETAVLPVEWTTSTAFIADAYCSYNGNVYQTTLGGTSGATPPTHTSSTASDGGVTWAYVSTPYAGFIADNDFCVLPEKVVELGAQWRFLRLNGQAYEDRRREAQAAVSREIVAKKGARTISLARPVGTFYIGPGSVPETGLGS